MSLLRPVESIESSNGARAHSLEGSRLGKGAAAMLSFIDARRNNSTKRMLKGGAHKTIHFPRRKSSPFEKVQGKI